MCDMHFGVGTKCWRRRFLEEKNITFIEDMLYEDMVYSLKGTIFANEIKYGEFPIYNYTRNRTRKHYDDTNNGAMHRYV
jgi:hypothetical protein